MIQTDSQKEPLKEKIDEIRSLILFVEERQEVRSGQIASIRGKLTIAIYLFAFLAFAIIASKDLTGFDWKPILIIATTLMVGVCFCMYVQFNTKQQEIEDLIVYFQEYGDVLRKEVGELKTHPLAESVQSDIDEFTTYLTKLEQIEAAWLHRYNLHVDR